MQLGEAQPGLPQQRQVIIGLLPVLEEPTIALDCGRDVTRSFCALGQQKEALGIEERTGIKMAGFILWVLLFLLCWPLALLVLIAYPVVWLLSIPLRLIGITLDAVFSFLKALLFLPARLLGGRT